jgi:hypothetical protein
MPAIEVIVLLSCMCGAMPELVTYRDPAGREHYRFACRNRGPQCLRGEGVVMRPSHRAWAKHYAAMAWQERRLDAGVHR